MPNVTLDGVEIGALDVEVEGVGVCGDASSAMVALVVLSEVVN